MPTQGTGRRYARRLYPTLGACEGCGIRPAVERHHRDGDPMNNSPENVQRLCRRCHQLVDGRLAALLAGAAAGRAAWRTARLSRETCPHGHPWTPDNTYVRPNGSRICRTCRRESQRR